MATTKVNSEFIAVNAISGTIIADGAITSTHLAANSVDTAELVTGSIDTIHIAANQVTSAKIVSDAVLTRHIADDQVTQALIAVNSVGISELAVTEGSDGQVLTTNGSGTLSFATVSGTTINNNADNRVITGSGTANTLEGESGLTYDGTTLQVQSGGNNRFKVNNSGASVESGHLYFNAGTGNLGNKYIFVNGGSTNDGGFLFQRENANTWQIAPDPNSDNDLNFYSYGTNSTALQIDKSTGQVNFGAGLGIGGTGAANTLDDYEEGTWTPAFYTYSGVTTSSITITLATYTKIGNICHIHANITATLSSLPGQTVTITGLPFAASGTDQYGIIAVGGHTVNTGANTPKAHFRTNGSQLDGIAYNASSNTAYWTYSSMDAQPFEMSIHGFYTTT